MTINSKKIKSMSINGLNVTDIYIDDSLMYTDENQQQKDPVEIDYDSSVYPFCKLSEFTGQKLKEVLESGI